MRAKLDSLCDQNLEITGKNLINTQDLIKTIQSLNPEGMKDHLKTMLTETQKTLQTRQADMRIPVTIPKIVKTYLFHTQQMAETSRIQRADESTILKVLCSPFSYSEINEFFTPHASDSLFGGHFKSLEAYVLGLIETPPLPDHYLYRLHKGNVERAEVKRKSILEMKVPLKKKSELLRPENDVIEQSTNLLSNELQELEELELKAEALLKDLAEKEAQKSVPKKKKKKKKKKKSKSIVASASATPLEVPAEADHALKEPSSTAQVQSSSDEESEQEEQLEETLEQLDLKPWEAYPKKKTSSSPQMPITVEEELPTVISVKKETYDLWKHFYENTTMEWKDFLPMITQTGFGIEPNGGSIHRILYPQSLRSHTGRRHLVVHKPHGQFSTLGHRTIGYLHHALTQDFGWSLKSFKPE